MSTDDRETEPIDCASRFCDQVLGWKDLETGEIEFQIETCEVNGLLYCNRCGKSAEWNSWLENTLDSVANLASKHGWEFNRHDYGGGFNTQSRYYTLTRTGNTEDPGDTESLVLRISDHGSAHCTEEISLAMEPSGDDHTLQQLAARLAVTPS